MFHYNLNNFEDDLDLCLHNQLNIKYERYTIGFYGESGSGKTTILSHLRNHRPSFVNDESGKSTETAIIEDNMKPSLPHFAIEKHDIEIQYNN
jgi:GTPase SAR1 family protein